jgi:hypothetical protein
VIVVIALCWWLRRSAFGSVLIAARDNEIVLQPLTLDYIRSVCGLFKRSTSATQELLRERARDRRRENRR